MILTNALRKRQALAQGQSGFTLIELLAVTLIIGILTAIAVPTYLGQTQRGFGAQMKSALRSLATNEESFLTDTNSYGTIADLIASGAVIARATDVTLTLLKYNNLGYCIEASHAKTTDTWYWDSQSGGLQPAGATGCPVVTTGTTGDALP